LIPQRIRLKGFLSYKGEQEVTFDGSSLWMLSGMNGSGKSSVFDAVTYALFGHHRGGGLHAVELINKESEGLVVEFDFLRDGHSYRAKRTLKRDAKGGARGTQQILRFQPSALGGGWVAVEGTNQKREFDAWVEDTIGLTYETFTSSVLLLQGKAEKLLDSKPEGRREVLAGIVDLERYEKLHKRADDERRQSDAAQKLLQKKLEVLPDVTPEQIAAAEQGITSAEERRTAVRAEVERLQALEYQAREWVKLQARVAETAARWQQASALLGDAAAIESAAERLNDLRAMLPRMKDIHVQRGQAHQARQEMDRLTKARQEVQGELAKREHALKQARDKRSSLQTLITTDEARQRTIVARLRDLAAQVEKLKECEQQEAELASIRGELVRMPADPAAALQKARERHDSLAALAPLAAQLTLFRNRREELREATSREQAARQVEQATLARGKQLGAEADRFRQSHEDAAKTLQKATAAAAAARTLLQQARASLKEVTELDGAKVCRHCGQALTEKHVEEEKERRASVVKAAEADDKKAAAALKAGREAEGTAREAFDKAEKARNDARVEYSDCKAALARAEHDGLRLRTECGQAYAELPPDHRNRVSATPPSDWLATTYPDADDMARVRAGAEGLPAAKDELRKAEQTYESWSRLQALASAAIASLERLMQAFPPDREAIRREHTTLSAEEKALEKNLAAKRTELKGTEQDTDRLTRDRDAVQAQQVDLDGKIRQQEVTRDHALHTSAQLVRTLPEKWRAEADRLGFTQVADWEGELRKLEADGTDERAKALAQAKVNLDLLQRERETLEAQRDAFPAEARRDPAAVLVLLTDARSADRACDEAIGNARQHLAQLEGFRRQRQQTLDEIRVTEGELEADGMLARLLGREYLQLYLVRQAEKQVVEYANAVLDRLSGGQLYLRLVGAADGEGGSDRALDLEAINRVTAEKPIGVAFLSGSQRFRVAVSLALGIGQYASKQHRPIESVIIDEGFGCLDRVGRQVMIQELQNLRSQMKCILLVSHQEEFADAFSDGYHFRLEDGATRVTRVQK
jgi:DNA repair exonuclease SbcCD ATPase subunit